MGLSCQIKLGANRANQTLLFPRRSIDRLARRLEWHDSWHVALFSIAGPVYFIQLDGKGGMWSTRDSYYPACHIE